MSPKPLLVAAALAAALATTPAQAITPPIVANDTWTVYDIDNFAWTWDGSAPADELPPAVGTLPPVPTALPPGLDFAAESIAAGGPMRLDLTGHSMMLAISPVPEPSALLALLAGLGVLSTMSRRRR